MVTMTIGIQLMKIYFGIWKAQTGIARSRRACLETYLETNLTIDLFLKFHLDNHLSMRRMLVKMNLTEIVITCQIKTNNHNSRDKLIIMIEGQYEQEPLNEEDVPCKPFGDNDEDLYGDENLANKDMDMLWKIILVFL